jgi:putative Ig domain-containing protein
MELGANGACSALATSWTANRGSGPGVCRNYDIRAGRARVPPVASSCGSVLLAGTAWLGGAGVDVESNGPDQGTGTSCGGTNTVNGIVSGFEWQCVELINRLYITRGWIGATWHGNGGDSSPGSNDSMFDRAPGSLSKQPNGSISFVAPGDVVSINVYHNGVFQPDGHVLIVNSAGTVTSGGVALVSQNAGSAANPIVTSSGTLGGGTLTMPSSGGWSYSVIGVVHAPATASAIETASLPDAVVGSPYSAPLAASGGKPPYAWQVSAGTLPSGLSLIGSGSITGTPVAEGPFPITVTVTDSAGTTASASLLLSSDGPQLLLVRQGSSAPVIGKIGLTDSWTPLTSLTGKIAVAGNRIAVLTPGQVLWAKDGLNGTWYQETNGVTAYALDG